MAAYTVNTYQPIDRVGLNLAIGQVQDLSVNPVLPHPLGTIVSCQDVSGSRGRARFILLKGVAATAVGSLVVVKGDFTTALGAARTKGGLALATAVCDAATKVAWYQIEGQGVAACQAGIVSDAQMFLAAGGTVDDAVVAGDAIIGMHAASTDDTSTCLVNMVGSPSAADFDNA